MPVALFLREGQDGLGCREYRMVKQAPQGKIWILLAHVWGRREQQQVSRVPGSGLCQLITKGLAVAPIGIAPGELVRLVEHDKVKSHSRAPE